MAPEVVPPGIVQFIQRPVFSLQPFAERLLAQFAVTCRVAEIPAQLIRNMPQDHVLPSAEPFREFPVDGCDLLPHHRRCVAEIMTLARQIPVAVSLHLHHFRIFLCQPVRHCTGGRCQDHTDSFLLQSGNDMIQPIQFIPPFLRLQRSPCKNTKCDAVHTRLFHELHVFLKHFRICQPLIWIIISSMK